MSKTLFSLCMAIIHKGVKAGTLVNLDELPPHIRQWIFVLIQSVSRKGIGKDDGLLPCLRRHRFFDGFQDFYVNDSIDCHRYNQLLSLVVAEIERTDSQLSQTLVSLRLRICIDHCCANRRTDQRTVRPVEPASFTNTADVCRLIAACGNLKRLDLRVYDRPEMVGYSDPNLDSINKSRLLDEIAFALRAGSRIERSPLEALTLRNFSDSHFGHSFSAFRELQFLKLRHCSMSAPNWSRLLKSCSRTLLALSLVKCAVEEFWLYQKFKCVELVALNALIIDCSRWYRDGRFLLSFETLGRPSRGRVCVFEDSEPDVLKTIGSCLSPEIELAYVLNRDSILSGLPFGHWLFGDRLVELRIIDVECFPEATRFDQVVGQLRSIRVLIMVNTGWAYAQATGDRFLHRFLSDVDRCANLRWLQVWWDLTTPTVRLVFRNCVNLEFLFLRSDLCWNRISPPIITDIDLMTWMANGARPSCVYLGYDLRFTDRTVKRLLKTCGNCMKASFVNHQGHFIFGNAHCVNIERIYNDLIWVN